MDTFEQLKQILQDDIGIRAEITLESGIKELGVDSLDLVEIVMAVEEIFDITVEDDDVTDFKTLGDVVKYIDSKR